MYFCTDVDLMVWEPGIFVGAAAGAFGHQALVKGAAGVLTGTSLVMGSAVLGSVAAGMVMEIVLADDSLTQLMEVVSVADGTHAGVSALRGRADEAPIGPLVGGNVKVTVVSYVPQIAAVGDDLLGLLGVVQDREHVASAVTGELAGFRAAAVFGTLAAIFRVLAGEEGAGAGVKAKEFFYEKLAAGTRRGIEGKVDADGDGVAETVVRGGVALLVRG